MKSLITTLSIYAWAFLQLGFAQETFRIYEEEIVIPTYQTTAPDKVPYFYKGRAYQGAQGRVYPYPFDGNLTDEKKDVAYKGLFIENKYLEICVLPELGGRLYYMKDKTNGYDVIYRNNVIKPSLIGMLGAWISGGIEWNVPHHHRASTFMPTDYELVENEDGSKTIWVGELEIRHQVRWMVGLTMFPNHANLKIDFKYINQTSQAHPFLIWANTAVHTNNNYQVIYPPKTEFATFHRKVDFTRWPISGENYRGNQFNHTDISLWKNTPEGGSFFAWEDQGQFVAGIDHGKNAGLCVVGNKNIIIGKKLWTWGTTPRADMWEQILSDEDGPYIEIMTGAYSNNQPDYSWCHPYFTKEATMYFMPLRGMKNVKESTLDAALNFEINDEQKGLIEVHAYADFQNATINVKKGNETLWTTTASLNPSTPGRWTFDIPEGHSYYDLSVEVLNGNKGELVSYQPQKKSENPLPETVKPAKSPDEIETVEDIVFTGLRMEQIFNPTVSPLSYYEEAIKREPENAFANLRIGAWYLKQGIFAQAETHLQRAADKWTTDYTRSKDSESFYLLGLTKLALDKEQEAYDNFYRASWDYSWYGASHLHLAMIESKRANYHEALGHIEKSLSVGTQNVRAREISTSLLRRLESPTSADAALQDLLEMDPLNLYAYGEKALTDKEKEKLFTQKMRGEVQNYLDMAVKLGNCGMYEEGIRLLKLAGADSEKLVSENALVHYYQGYYEHLIGNESESLKSYQKAAKMTTDYCFPFRFETEKVLAHASKVNPTDANAWYYWGNLLYDHQPGKAVEKWAKAIELNPAFAMAHRNLAFAADHINRDAQKAREHISLAIQHNPKDPDFYFEQDNYALKLGESLDFRLSNLTKAGDIIDHKDNPLSRIVEIKLLTDSEDEALEILKNHHFRKVEGVGNIHNIWVNAWLVKGKKALIKGAAKSALNSFEKSLEYPRNLDIGRNSREGQSHYFIGLALEKSGKKKMAKQHYQKALESRFNTNEMFFKGMAYMKLGEKEKGIEIFKELAASGNKIIQRIGETDFFSMFGNDRSDNLRLADAHALIGLSHWGMGKRDEAEAAFAKALKEDPANFTAKSRLFDLEAMNR